MPLEAVRTDNRRAADTILDESASKAQVEELTLLNVAGVIAESCVEAPVEEKNSPVAPSAPVRLGAYVKANAVSVAVGAQVAVHQPVNIEDAV
jgi:hypothetical protein